MSVVNELINAQGESLEFGNYELGAKTKKDGFEFQGDIYKIKTFNEITKLEKNGMFVYESVPGTAVHGFKADENDVTFVVEGPENASITLELEPETEYKVHVDDVYVGKNKTNLGGKMSISVDLEEGRPVKVDVKRAFDYIAYTGDIYGKRKTGVFLPGMWIRIDKMDGAVPRL